jgi:hypothetical protein
MVVRFRDIPPNNSNVASTEILRYSAPHEGSRKVGHHAWKGCLPVVADPSNRISRRRCALPTFSVLDGMFMQHSNTARNTTCSGKSNDAMASTGTLERQKNTPRHCPCCSCLKASKECRTLSWPPVYSDSGAPSAALFGSCARQRATTHC